MEKVQRPARNCGQTAKRPAAGAVAEAAMAAQEDNLAESIVDASTVSAVASAVAAFAVAFAVASAAVASAAYPGAAS